MIVILPKISQCTALIPGKKTTSKKASNERTYHDVRSTGNGTHPTDQPSVIERSDSAKIPDDKSIDTSFWKDPRGG